MVKQRIVVKVGSNVLTDINRMPDRETMQHVVLELANLHRAGNEVLLITSGAVAFGRSLLPLDDNKNVVAVRQLLSAIGQASLIESYRQLFKPHSILCAQVLVTKEDFRAGSIF